MQKHDDEYYYQVQTHMGVAQLQYTNFVVRKEVIINRIKFDASFYDMITKEAKLFLLNVLAWNL